MRFCCPLPASRPIPEAEVWRERKEVISPQATQFGRMAGFCCRAYPTQDSQRKSPPPSARSVQGCTWYFFSNVRTSPSLSSFPHHCRASGSLLEFAHVVQVPKPTLPPLPDPGVWHWPPTHMASRNHRSTGTLAHPLVPLNAWEKRRGSLSI